MSISVIIRKYLLMISNKTFVTIKNCEKYHIYEVIKSFHGDVVENINEVFAQRVGFVSLSVFSI